MHRSCTPTNGQNSAVNLAVTTVVTIMISKNGYIIGGCITHVYVSTQWQN